MQQARPPIEVVISVNVSTRIYRMGRASRIGRPLAHDIAHDPIAGVVLGQAVEWRDPATQRAQLGGRHRSAGPHLA
jgi:hypothetical protein